MIVYKLDSQNVFIGAVEINKNDRLPAPCVTTAPPEIHGSEVAMYSGGAWIILNEYPNHVKVTSVPQTITPRQLRLQLLSLGLLDDVEALCATDRAMSIWFEYSLDFQRNHEMIIAMGTQLGMSESDMDTFFIEASKL